MTSLAWVHKAPDSRDDAYGWEVAVCNLFLSSIVFLFKSLFSCSYSPSLGRNDRDALFSLGAAFALRDYD